MQYTHYSLATKTIWINARFLGRPVTGVERVARELLNTLVEQHLDSKGCWTDGRYLYQFKLIAPHSVKIDSPWPNLPLQRCGLFNGHAWEQFDLPRITWGDCLLSLCNTGPLFKTEHVIFLHDAQPFAIPRNFSVAFRSWYRLMFTMAARNARQVLVNSAFTRDELGHYIGLDCARTQLCYLGWDHIRRVPTQADCLARFDLPEAPFVLAVSSANPNKNFQAVIKALELMGEKAPPCVIVGQQSQAHFGETRIDPEKVLHLGYVTDRELLALYRKALCLAFPSFYEGFGLPPLEAMATGCPVIVSNTSSLKEIGADAVTYCDPEDPSTLAAGIAGLATSSSVRQQFIAKGVTRALEFSWSSCTVSMLKAISKSHERAVSGTVGNRENPAWKAPI